MSYERDQRKSLLALLALIVLAVVIGLSARVDCRTAEAALQHANERNAQLQRRLDRCTLDQQLDRVIELNHVIQVRRIE